MPDQTQQFTQAPPLAKPAEEEGIRKLDNEINKLRQTAAKLRSASGGSTRALAEVTGAASPEAARGQAVPQETLRFQRQQIEQQISQLEGQRQNLMQGAQQRVLAKAMVEINRMAPADQTLIAGVRQDVNGAKQQLGSLLTQARTAREQADTPTMFSSAMQAQNLANAIGLVEEPATILGDMPDAEVGDLASLLPGAQGKSRVAQIVLQTQQALNEIIPAEAAFALSGGPASRPFGGAEGFGTSPGAVQLGPGGPPPEGFTRQPGPETAGGLSPFGTPVGPSQELVAPAGQQLAFQGQGNQILAGTVPQGTAARGPLGAGFSNMTVNPELTQRLNMAPVGEAAPGAQAAVSPSQSRMQTTGSPVAAESQQMASQVPAQFRTGLNAQFAPLFGGAPPPQQAQPQAPGQAGTAPLQQRIQQAQARATMLRAGDPARGIPPLPPTQILQILQGEFPELNNM